MIVLVPSLVSMALMFILMALGAIGMTRTMTVEVDMADDDVKYELVTQGSTATPSRQVPSGVSEIQHIVASLTSDAAASGSAVFFIRLFGGGISGVQEIVIGAASHIAVQSGADSTGQRSVLFQLEDVNIAVTPGESITVEGEHAGDDLGTAHMLVTLIFG